VPKRKPGGRDPLLLDTICGTTSDDHRRDS
jgi:hypothetical protein